MKILKFLNNKAEEWILVFLLIVIVFLVSLQVITRYLFNFSLTWSEELSRYILVWIAWIGASFAVRKNEHLRVEIIKNYLNAKYRKILELFVLFIWFFLPLTFAIVGTEMVMMIADSGQTGQTLNFPIWIAYSIIPFGGVLMCLRLIQQFINILKSINTN